MGIKSHPSDVIVGSVAQSSAVAPAGGCTVFVMPITADATPTESAPATHRSDSKCGERWNSLVMLMPMVAEKIWPNRVLRGCARGESIVWYSRIAVAPYSLYQHSARELSRGRPY